jgi:SAM-dependent methyltransferase
MRTNFASLRESFADPGAEWRPMPFWFWNSRLDPAEIERQVYLMHEAGLGGFFMHARFGLETEYMSEDWMLCVRKAVRAAQQCGLRAWLYDEYPFPSGVGGLEVTRNPEYCNKFIDLVEGTFTGPAEASLPLPEGEPLAAYAVRIPGLTGDQMEQFQERAVHIPLKEGAHRGAPLLWHAPEGEWLVMVFVQRVLQDPRGNVFGPDYLNPRMTEAFLKLLDRYVEDKELKPYLGGTIPGIFTDEPCILAWHQNHTNYPAHHNARIAVWSDQLPERLQQLGYDWQQVLPAIFYDLGSGSAALRHAYRQAVADNYIESFFVPYQQWCQKHRLKLTGHLLLEEGLYTNTIFQGDFIRALSIFDIPGADHLGIGCEDKYGGWGNLPLMSTNVQGQKLVSSIAHLYGKEAVLSESFGVSGWGLTMADMKRIVDWQYRLGVNFLCPHAFYYSTEGFRKHDSPPSQFFQAAYWPYYRYFADYVARLSLLMRAGKHVAQAALFYPQDAFWEAFKAGKEDTLDRRLADQFDFYASELLRCHVDYDIVPAPFITMEATQNGTLRINNEEYALIILPAVPNVSDSLLDALSQFYQKGGKLLLSDPAPDLLLARLQSLPSPQGMFIILDGIQPEHLKAALQQLIIPDVRVDHREVTYVHRETHGKHICFFASDSDQPLDARLEMNVHGRVEQWDLETGQIRDIAQQVTEDGYTRVDWNFAPHGSLMLVVDPDRAPLREQFTISDRAHTQVLGDTWEFTCLSPNALLLDRWNVQITARGDWLHYDYTTDVRVEAVPKAMHLLLDDIESRGSFMAGMRLQIYVNEQEIAMEPSDYYVDPKWKTFQITDRLRPGVNRIHLRFTNQSWAGEPKAMTIPPKLLGDFALVADSGDRHAISTPRTRIRSCASWTDQGYPFYSGTAIYAQQVTLDGGFLLAHQIWIEAMEVADMVEFVVNDTCAAVRPWPPYRCEIRPLLHPGQNILTLKITNSMQNSLEGVAKPSGLLGYVRLETA